MPIVTKITTEPLKRLSPINLTKGVGDGRSQDSSIPSWVNVEMNISLIILYMTKLAMSIMTISASLWEKTTPYTSFVEKVTSKSAILNLCGSSARYT